jgi:hypothetical protein
MNCYIFFQEQYLITRKLVWKKRTATHFSAWNDVRLDTWHKAISHNKEPWFETNELPHFFPRAIPHNKEAGLEKKNCYTLLCLE